MRISRMVYARKHLNTRTYVHTCIGISYNSCILFTIIRNYCKLNKITFEDIVKFALSFIRNRGKINLYRTFHDTIIKKDLPIQAGIFHLYVSYKYVHIIGKGIECYNKVLSISSNNADKELL